MVALAAALPARIGAHDMPSDVRVRMFVGPADGKLQLLVRLPLISLLNINLPKRGEQYLDLAAVEPSLREAAKATADAVDVFESDAKLGSPRLGEVRVSLPSDPSFTSYESALSHLRGPRLPVDTEVVWDQGFFDALLEYDIRSSSDGFSIEPYFNGLAPHVASSVGFVLPTGSIRAFELSNDPGRVYFEPTWFQSAATFVWAGVLEVVRRTELLLFLIALSIPLRRARSLASAAAAFTIAAASMLILAAYQITPGGAWFQPSIAALTAIGIVVMTIDNVFVAHHHHRWVLAFIFGLVFGCALSFALRQTLQFAGSHFLTSVLAFSAGGSLAVVLCLLGVAAILSALFRIAVSERVGVVVVSALVCHTAWHWMVSRVMFLISINWPLADVVEVMRWSTAAAVIAAAVVFGVGVARTKFRLGQPQTEAGR